MLEGGYQTTMTLKAPLDAVGVVLRKERERFIQRGSKWTARRAVRRTGE